MKIKANEAVRQKRKQKSRRRLNKQGYAFHKAQKWGTLDGAWFSPGRSFHLSIPHFRYDIRFSEKYNYPRSVIIDSHLFFQLNVNSLNENFSTSVK